VVDSSMQVHAKLHTGHTIVVFSQAVDVFLFHSLRIPTRATIPADRAPRAASTNS
jgi:hypothetical protein